MTTFIVLHCKENYDVSRESIQPTVVKRWSIQTIILVLKTGNSETVDSLLNRKLTFDIYILIFIFSPGKKLCKQPLTPSEIASFWTPSPRNFRCPSWGLWIFSGTTHYTQQREAIDEKKSFKILQQINLLTGQKYKYSYCKCKLQIYNYYKCLPSECSLATDSDTFIFCKHYFSRIMFMFYIFVFFVGIKWWE